MNGQSDWPKSHLCPKWPILIGQMRFREVATQIGPFWTQMRGNAGCLTALLFISRVNLISNLKLRVNFKILIPKKS